MKKQLKIVAQQKKEPIETNIRCFSSDQTREKNNVICLFLQEAYDIISEEELEKPTAKIEPADARSKHAESWKIINQITARKSVKQAIIKGSSKEDRIKKWYDQFQNVLGKYPVVANESHQ